ncbi:Leucine-rich repeat transmembrane protein kinase [Perilla frutescens var. hirtella]|nr:Leucine-rich repeat transmembrane protein kinase [Perilla frutescens var. hirtella]
MFLMAAAPSQRQRRLNSRRRLLVFWLVFAFAQSRTIDATTDPSEARALNRIFERWEISATNQWNISGELCSGIATDATDIETENINPGIKCDCSYDNKSRCHIITLRVYALNVVGPLPDELWNLTYLTNLNLAQNYLMGPFPADIGKLRRLQYLTVGINALSGKVPKELGQLTDLRSLAFGINNFSGPLPSELGNLSRLEQIYFDSAGVSGPIPPTFANLRSMQSLWAADNELTGQIPDFIGNWSNILQLRFRGNSFQGQIPLSFSNLTSLNDLRITDLSNGSSSLDFLRHMKSLSTLILRNNKISGPIPSYFGEFQSLELLDLSFNNLTGTVPDSLFNHISLNYLFLGNNKLTGGLPAQKSPSLQNIDLSYNELSGSFPSWLSTQNLQVNLVSNSFTIEGSSSSALPSGLDCLQRNFPCKREPAIYSSFAVKCGGPEIRSSDLVYEMDNKPLGPATYYVSNTRRWAVSNAGVPVDDFGPQPTNTLDSGLFQTARISAGSLRYYGFGLQNGKYNVTLQFAEIAMRGGTNTWQSLGRRVFDIYIQGNLELKDFDILREAGGVALTAVVRQFNVTVLENYLEVHLFWAGKGTCCVPRIATYGPSISAISATPNFVPAVFNNPPGRKKDRISLFVGIIIPVTAAISLSLFAFYYVSWRWKRQKQSEDDELLGIDVRPYTFSFAELKGATDDFDPANKLGEGGFGPVYKGTLEDGRVVAVKQLSVSSHQGKSQFLAEIATISAVRHRNLVKLYGCCLEGDKRLLVYEYLENKSLDKNLFGAGSEGLSLDRGRTRFDICLGVARGLAYLHEESQVRIVHRDVKASNILLDSDLTPKISDFGLAKLYDDKKTHISTRVAGTIGYLAPEYAMRGHLTEKADVFSFGVLALEIISGRPNADSTLDDDRIYLLEWAWNLHENNKEIELVNSRIQEHDADELRRMIGVALLCTQASPGSRPAMSRVVAMLSGDIQVTSASTKPSYLNDWNFNDATNSDADISHATTAATDPFDSPVDPSKPILHLDKYLH